MRVQTTVSTGGRNHWPDAVTYREAIQSPSVALSDPDLKGATVFADRLGMPIAYTGRFAVVFRLRAADGDWAVRCFTHNADASDRRRRYTAIDAAIEALPEYFVPFRYHDRGIQIGGEWYPVVAMRWAEGETLGRFVERHRRDPFILRRLADSLSWLLERLEKAGIAHGDWQHDNILVSGDGTDLTLVDYDGMYVPDLAGLEGTEIGHANYQHPRRSRSDFGAGMDRFSHLAIRTALLALARDPSLWDRFSDGESILFTDDDYAEPARSRVFAAVAELTAGDPDLSAALEALIAACMSPQPIASDVAKAAAADMRQAADRPWWLDRGTVIGDTTRDRPPIVIPQEAVRSATEVLSQALMDEEAAFIERVRADGFGALFGLIAIILLVAMFGKSVLPVIFMAGPTFAYILLSTIQARWPRKRAYDELVRQQERLEILIEERRLELRGLYARMGLPKGVTSLAEYVRFKLRQVPVSAVLSLPGVSRATFDILIAERVATAEDLLNRTRIPGVPPHEMDVLRLWCDRLNQEAADEFARFIAPRLSTMTDREMSEEIDRLERETGAFEAEFYRLKRETSHWPDMGTETLVKLVLGMK